MAAPAHIARENGKKGGRPKGSKSQSTLERERVFAEVKNRIMNQAQRILDSQMSLAQGQQFLYRIDTEIDGKGKKTRSKPVLVVNPEEIANYLDGEYGDGETLNSETEYYYITTKEPNNMSIDSMFDRTFGKSTQAIEVSGKNGGPITITGMKIIKDGDPIQNQES